MDTLLASRIKHKIQEELVRRELIQFFIVKGYENFDMPLYPPSAYDLPARVPRLFTRCEIVPTVEETDITLGTVKLTWNLFVLGTQRMNLGSTTHSGQSDITRAIVGEPNADLPADFITTPKKVIEFIIKILKNSKSGFVELPPDFQVPPGALEMPLLSKSRSPRLNPSSSGSFYSS